MVDHDWARTLGPATLTNRSIRNMIDHGDRQKTREAIERHPDILSSAFGRHGETMLHLIARRGNSALLTLVTQVADDIRSTRANTGLSSLDMMRSGSSSSSLATAMHPACSMQSHTTNQAKHVKSLFACFGGRKKVCRQASVETTEPLMDVIVNAANAKGMTPLMLAASCGHAAMVKDLIGLGARVDTVDKEGCTALMYASRYGHRECCRALVDRAGNIMQAQPSLRQPSGQGPALNQGGLGSAITIAGTATVTPLSSATVPEPPAPGPAQAHMAPEEARAHHINTACKAGATALHYAAEGGHTECVQLLLKGGADMALGVHPTRRMRWLVSHQGATALHLAAQRNHMEVALMLVAHYLETGLGPDPRTLPNRAGQLPHQIAHMAQHFRLSMMLRYASALHPMGLDARPPHRVGRTRARSSKVPTLAKLAAEAQRAHLHALMDALGIPGGPQGILPADGPPNTNPPFTQRPTQTSAIVSGMVGLFRRSPTLASREGSRTGGGATPHAPRISNTFARPSQGPRTEEYRVVLPPAQLQQEPGSAPAIVHQSATRVPGRRSYELKDLNCRDSATPLSRHFLDEEPCGVCFEDGDHWVYMMPCAHRVCGGCARSMVQCMKSKPMACPFCRGIVHGFHK